MSDFMTKEAVRKKIQERINYLVSSISEEIESMAIKPDQYQIIQMRKRIQEDPIKMGLERHLLNLEIYSIGQSIVVDKETANRFLEDQARASECAE